LVPRGLRGSRSAARVFGAWLAQGLLEKARRSWLLRKCDRGRQGHRTLREIARYTAAADQARMAQTAIDTMVTAFPVKRISTSRKD
jgi:hypothetical protein